MLGTLWDFILINPMLNALVAFYNFSGNLGAAIIFLTIMIRGILVPVMIPSMRTMQKQRDLQGELNEIKTKFKHDKSKQAQLQMELFKKHGINPTSGCLSQILMLFVLIALFSVIRMLAVETNIESINSKLYIPSFRFEAGETIDTKFLYMNLSKPDPFFVLAVLSGLLQLIASKMSMPYVEKASETAKKTPSQSDDVALAMQQQSLIMLPLMNVVFGITLPSGVMLYIVITTIFTIVQTYFMSGLGGLKPWINNVKSLKAKYLGTKI